MGKFKFTSRVTLTKEDAGKLVEELISGLALCDFCADDRVRFEIPCQPFKAGKFESDDAWAVCAPCALLIDLRAYGALEERVFNSWVKLGAIYPTMRDDIQRILMAFRKHSGVAIPFTPTEK